MSDALDLQTNPMWEVRCPRPVFVPHNAPFFVIPRGFALHPTISLTRAFTGVPIPLFSGVVLSCGAAGAV
jgi:hypothetical protein